MYSTRRPDNAAETAGRPPAVVSRRLLRSAADQPYNHNITLQYIEPIYFSARQRHSASFIMLHGFNEDGARWAELFKSTLGARLQYLKITLPTAPKV